MHVAVDAHNLLYDRRGIGVYMRAVLSRMLATDVTITLLLREFLPQRLRRDITRELDSNRFHIAGRVPRDADVLWHPWNGTFFDSGTVPEVVTIHDVVPFAYPALDEKRRRSQQEPFLRSAHADHIITDSEFSRAEILRYLPVAPEKISVVFLAALGPADRKHNGTPGTPLPRQPYILAVGANDFRKNLNMLAQAHRIAFPGNEVDLICVGKGAPEGAIELTDVSFERLQELYTGAIAVAVPSIYEGFGMPPLEAMACGTPVVVSRAASLPEVCGEAALYVEDPMSVHEWSVTLQKIVRDKSLRRELRDRGYKQEKKFSWDLTAKQTRDILEEVARLSRKKIEMPATSRITQ